jgi:hypothetical protein
MPNARRGPDSLCRNELPPAAAGRAASWSMQKGAWVEPFAAIYSNINYGLLRSEEFPGATLGSAAPSLRYITPTR